MENKSTENLSEKSDSVVLRDTLLILGVMLVIGVMTVLYAIYALGLYRDDRWIPFVIYIGIAIIPVSGIMLFFIFRWAREVNEFDKVLLAGEEPTKLHAENAIRSIFKWISHGAFLLGLLMAMMIAIVILIMYKHYGFSSREAVFGVIFGVIAGLNLCILQYYTGKISEQRRIGESVERLLVSGVYEWPHFKLSIRYKIFLVIFGVVAYLLWGAIITGFTQVENSRRVQLQENLRNWVRLLPKYIKSSADIGRSGAIESILFEDQLNPDFAIGITALLQ